MRVLTTPLDASWQFAERLPAGRDFFFPQGGEKTWLPAEVPGAVHLDLMRAGVIGDPFYRMQERGCQWVDEADWTYRTTFAVDEARFAARGEHGRHFLLFHGLDTLCRVYLNEVQIGTAENFFVPHRFDVTDTLQIGENVLRVEFDSALRVGRERAKAYLGDGTSERGAMSYFNFGPRAFVRKPQYMFGWDWGPELVSCGIWQKVELITVPVAEITDYHFTYTMDGDTAHFRLIVDIDRYDANAPLRIQPVFTDINRVFTEASIFWDDVQSVVAGKYGITVPKITVPTGIGQTQVAVTGRIEHVGRWQPNGMGDANRYNLYLSLFAGEEDIVTTKPPEIGFRTVELVQEPDAVGTGKGFLFRINGVDTYIKGANWIPMDCFPSRKRWRTIEEGLAPIDDRLHKLLKQAKDAGFNMLRVWGGGVYESEDFYILCDRLGILVWQDFPFACSSYPDDLADFSEQVRAEAALAIKRIRNHPCLALWCGGNENLQLFQQRWDRETQATKFFGDKIIHDILPAVLAEHDPTTPYWPNSPYSGAPNADSQLDTVGDAHYWNVWHGEGDWVHYTKNHCRFSSEFGFAAPAGHAAWGSCMAPEDKAVRSAVSQWHDKTRKGYETYLGYIGLHYPAPQTFDDLIYYGQCNQADALKHGVEHWRREKGHCSGTLFWQFNDCWPTHSWAIVDSAGEPKAAYYAAKRFYAPLLLSLVREKNVATAYLVNDTLADVPGALSLRLLTFTGDVLATEVLGATAPENAASGPVTLLDLTAAQGRENACFVHATFTDTSGALLAENFLLLAEPKDLQLTNPGLQATFAVQAIGANPYRKSTVLHVSATRFAGYVALSFDGMDKPPALSDNFFHLAPGQARTIVLSDTPRLSEMRPEQIASYLRLRHL